MTQFRCKYNCTPIIHIILWIFFEYSHSHQNKSTNICNHLTDGFRFNFALNQHIPGNQIYGSVSKDIYAHYLVSQNHFLRFTFPTNEPKVKLEHIPLEQSLQSLNYDIGFSLWGNPPKQYESKLCFLQFLKSELVCFNLTQSSIINIEKFQFKLPPSYYPSVAFQDVRYTEKSNSRYTITFIDQRLRHQNLDKIQNGTTSYYYERHFQSYSFENMDRIINLTESAVILDYLELVPPHYEITGVFNWNGNKRHEYLLLAFNGTHHLYCLNKDCQHANSYLSFMNECRVQGQKEIQNGILPIQMIDHHAKLDEMLSAISGLSYYSTDNYSELRKHHYSMYLVSGMFFLIMCLAILIVSVCYYSVKEVRLQEQQLKRIYEKSIFLNRDEKTSSPSSSSEVDNNP